MHRALGGFLVFLAFLMVALATVADASAPPESPGKSDSPQGWMPDVADRVAALRERTNHATAEARRRTNSEAAKGEWWRHVAAMPSRERVQ